MKESNTSPWMAFWGEDFNRSTIGWSLEERGAYHFLLWHSWSCDGLPPELDRIFRLDPDLKRLWPCLESKFPIAEDGRRRNPRQERGRMEMINISSGKSKAGKLGASKRWQQDNGICHASAINLPMAEPMRSQWQTDGYSPSLSPSPSLSLPSANPSAIKHMLTRAADEPECEIKKTAKSIPSSEIERVWECFPRKVGKLKSLALIRKACDLVAIEHDLLDAADAVEYMIEKVNLFADECRKKATEPQFIPHPQTWLNGGRYLDPVVTESH